MKRMFVSLIAALMAGCAAPAPQYYSLQAPAIASQSQERKVASDYVISVQPVLIPEQLARPQIVVATPDSAEVIPLNAALWAGPLEAQIRDALADALTERLNVVDVGLSRVEGPPVWRIYVDVQRFDSVYDEAIRQDVVWRMVPQGMPEQVGKRVCSAQLRLAVGTGMSALVEGHRQSLNILADVMARTLPGQGDGSVPDAAPEGLNFRGCVG